jgi:hypothetical protein
MLVKAGMSTKDVVYGDVTVLVPPIDRVARRLAHRWHEHPERTVSRGWQKHFGTAFMVVATPSPGPYARTSSAGGPSPPTFRSRAQFSSSLDQSRSREAMEVVPAVVELEWRSPA